MFSNAYLILEDGSTWPGKSFGASPPHIHELGSRSLPHSFDGEVIFNTGMTGYHEILTDPSYTGQIVLMTYPHIGNYGDADQWSEVGPEAGSANRRRVKVQGLVVRSVHMGPIPDGRTSLASFLERNAICGISEVDTRTLTLKLREEGSCNGIIVANDGHLSDAERNKAVGYIAGLPSMVGRNLSAEVGILEAQDFNSNGCPHVALLDCGVKMNIIRELESRGCRITVLPSHSHTADILDLGADALLFSNGPGDPEPLHSQRQLAESLMGKIRLWGICLGHQILASACGGKTYKMKFGHHGINHPVRDENTGRVFVTSQNHGFAVDEHSLPAGCSIRFRNANDGTVEGFENPSLGILCVQHHPEAAPGPVDSRWVFDAFLATLED